MIENALSLIMGVSSVIAWFASKKISFLIRYAGVKSKKRTIEVVVIGFFFILSIDQLILLILMVYLYFAKIESKHSFFLYENGIKSNLKKVSISLYYLLLIWPIIYLISFMNNMIITNSAEQNIVLLLKDGSLDEQIYIIISAIIIAPIIEELYFRGILYSKIKLHFGILPSIIISSMLFGIIHKNIYAFITLFTLSVFLCIIKEISGNILFPVYVHSIFNIVMVIQIMF